ncbi:MAG: tRNA (guanine(46)-N(7))-methyltransferase TrmB [Rickettsiales bacterium]
MENPIVSPYLRSFGRKKSRTLSALKQNALEGNLSGIGITAEYAASVDVINPAELFPPQITRYEMEIGFGSGENLAARAVAYPHTGFIGAEPYINGVASCVLALRKSACRNVRIWNDDVRPLLATWKKRTLRRIFILYPDPWPKAKHHKKRLVQSAFLRTLAPLLSEDGRICLVTDHEDYARHMQEAMETASDVLTLAPPLEEDAPHSTKYRIKADAAHRPVFRFDLRAR